MPFRPRQSPSIHGAMRYDQLRPSATRWEGIKASFQNTRDRTMMGGLLHRIHSPDREGGVLLSADEANRLYPEVEAPFTRPVNRDFAQYVADRQRQKHAMEMIAASAPGDTLQTILNFGGAMGASVIDPVELAITAGAAGLIFKGLRSANILQNATRRTEFARAAMANTAGAVAVEPFLYRDAGFFQEERSLDEAFASVAASAILGTFLDYGIGRLLNRGTPEADMAYTGALANIGKKYDPSILDTSPPAVRGSSSDLVVREMPTPGQRQIGFDGDFGPSSGGRGPDPRGPRGQGPNKRPDGKMDINEFSYTFGPMADGPSFKRFYTVTSSSRGKLQGGKTPLMSLLMDQGLQFSDNPRRAATFADTPVGGTTSIGSLREVRINEGNFIDADIPYQHLDRAARKLLDSLGRGREGMTLAEALRDIRLRDASKIETNLRRIMDEEGIDGFYFVENVGGESSNNLYLRDSSKFTEQKSYEVFKNKPSPQNDPSTAMRDYVASERSDFYYDERISKMYDEITPEFRDDFDFPPMETVSDLDPEFSALSARDNLPREVREAVETVNLMKEELEKIPEVVKSAFFCGRG